jgi:hypothetical protein
MARRFYFNVENDHSELDPEGTELADIAEARAQAILMMGHMLQDATGSSPWNGNVWKVWVSDGPRGSGHVIFTLQLSAVEGT